MIKKYNQFIKENDEFDEEPSFEETEGKLAEEDLQDEMSELDSETIDMTEEEDEYVGQKLLEELAEKLGAEVVNNQIQYEGKTINFYSETEKFHIGKKKFSTPDEVINFLKKEEKVEESVNRRRRK